MSAKRIYLDANGASIALPQVQEILAQHLQLIGNPSSSHEHGRRLRALIDDAREHVAHALNARGKDVIFTSGASEANRLFVDSLRAMARDRGRALKIVMSPFEHPSLHKPIVNLALEHLANVDFLPLDYNGSVEIDTEVLFDADVVIACHAHNETGIITDVDALATKVSKDTLVMSDVSQAMARLNPLSDRVDVMTFSAQKIGGYAGAGGIALRSLGKKLAPPWLGGGQERGFRPGTESTLMLLACGEAAKHIDDARAAHQRLASLRNYLEEELESHVPLKVIGKKCARLPNTSAISFFAEDADALRIGCDLAGLSVGFGAACSGLAPEGSFALKRLGLSAHEEKTTVRFSLSATTTKEEIDETIKRLREHILNHKSRA